MQPFMSEIMLQGLDYFWRMRSMLELDALPSEQQAQCLPFIVRWAQGARSMTGPEVFQATAQIHATRVATVTACNAFDFVLSPVAPFLPFKAENASPANDPQRALEHIGFTVPYNMSEQPAASVNWGYALNDNAVQVPIGVQVAGARADDRGVLMLSRVIEILRPTQLPWPNLTRV
jgi:Asp-tRNA(Asn)/Glu-tRNA(Gln) amidotransferase A subunit family amidase